MNNGDVLILEDGRILRIIQKRAEIDEIDLGIVQFVDKNEESYLNLDHLEIKQNVGSEPETVANFYFSWGVHKRINMLGL